MFRRVWLLIMVACCFLANTGDSQEQIRILVLPFEVYSQENLSYLQKEIPAAVQDHLEQHGAVILNKDIISDAS